MTYDCLNHFNKTNRLYNVMSPTSKTLSIKDKNILDLHTFVILSTKFYVTNSYIKFYFLSSWRLLNNQ